MKNECGKVRGKKEKETRLEGNGEGCDIVKYKRVRAQSCGS
jgi:hypothetical protein